MQLEIVKGDLRTRMKQEAEEERGRKNSGWWELPGSGDMWAHTRCGVHRPVTPI